MIGDSPNNSRSRILSRLKENTVHNWAGEWSENVPVGDVFPKPDNLVSAFQQELVALGGEVFLEENKKALFGKLYQLLEERTWELPVVAEKKLLKKLLNWRVPVAPPHLEKEKSNMSISRCEALIASTGSVLVSCGQGAGRKMNIFPNVHVVIAKQSQLVESIEEGFRKTEERYLDLPSQISLISGPSRTADIEKTLVMGAHGPKELIVLIDMSS